MCHSEAWQGKGIYKLNVLINFNSVEIRPLLDIGPPPPSSFNAKTGSMLPACNDWDDDFF